jgi:integrase/recombinase XerD
MVVKDIDEWISNRPEHSDIYKKIYGKMYTQKHPSIVSNLQNMELLIRCAPEYDYWHLSEDAVEDILRKVYKRYPNQYSRNNKYMFFRNWLKFSNQNDLLPLVKAPKIITEPNDDKQIEIDEIRLMISKAKYTRDKAIIALLYDSGCRIGELCTIKVKHVEFDSNGARVTLPKSKTTWRTNRVVFASSYLNMWLSEHQYKDNPEAPLFYSFQLKNGQAVHLLDGGIRWMLKNTLEDCGIKRRIYPHMFRHTRVTELANFMTERQLKKQFGWTPNSNTASVYVNMNNVDTENAVLKAAGIEVDEPEKEILKPVRCPRCKEINSQQDEYCVRCVLPLSEKAIFEADKKQRETTLRLEIMEKTISNFHAFEKKMLESGKWTPVFSEDEHDDIPDTDMSLEEVRAKQNELRDIEKS